MHFFPKKHIGLQPGMLKLMAPTLKIRDPFRRTLNFQPPLHLAPTCAMNLNSRTATVYTCSQKYLYEIGIV